MQRIQHLFPAAMRLDDFVDTLIENTRVAVGTGFNPAVFEVPFTMTDLRYLLGYIE